MKSFVAWVLCITAVLTGCAPSPGGTGPNRYQASFLTLFDTATIVIGYETDEKSFTENATRLYDELEGYHRLYDIYHSYDGINNLKTVNDSAGAAPVKVDERIIGLLEFCIEMYELTDGKMNIAMGSVLSVWHDLREAGIDDPEHARLPDMNLLKAAAKHTDITKIIIDRHAMTVCLNDSEMKLDVGGVAKGYAAEQVCRAMEAGGMRNVLLSVGGNVRTIGPRGDGSDWEIGVRSPFAQEEQTYLYKLGLRDLSLVSSGSYQRYYTVEGKTYHHIIHPDTLMPREDYVSVTILCAHSGMADALSTAIFNMDQEAGLMLIEGMENVEAMWVYPDGKEAFSSGFEQYMIE